MPAYKLKEEDINECQKAFSDLDEEGIGAIKAADLKSALDKIEFFPSENDLYKMISEFDEGNEGLIKFNDFLNMFCKFKESTSDEDDQDTIDAFVSLGGKEDKSGHIDAQILIKIIKIEFQMTIDIEKLIQEIDEDGSGQIEFGEFKTLLKTTYGQE